jgi:hypothetical protein
MRVTPGGLKVLETIRLEEMSYDRTRIFTFLHFQNMRFLTKWMGNVAARFLEGRMKHIDRLASRA